MVFLRSAWSAKFYLFATFAQLYDQSSYLYLLGRSDWRSVLTGRSKRPMQMRSWHHWLKWIINDLIPSGYLHKKDVHSNSTLVVTPEGLKTANAELAFFNSRVFVNYSSSVEAQLVSRRRYASVVFLLLTCLINLCCLTLIGRRKVKSQLLFFSWLLVLHCLFSCFYQQYKIVTQLVSVISLRLLILYC